MRKILAAQLAMLASLVFLPSAGHLTAAQRNPVRRRALQPVAGQWYTFTSPDRDFTLDFPCAPKRGQDRQGLVTMIRTYDVSTEAGMQFSVNFQDIGGDPRSRQNNEFAADHEEIVAAAAREQGRRVVQVHRLAKNVIEMEYLVTVEETKADINYMERTILRRGRVYSLACGSVVGGREMDKSICRKFFSSMRFPR